ncbi:MAG: hypothetical protein A4E36_01489 [Methanoregulaceae archaeon PtaB.Bin009]|nr:MAG: hypothetical protein A4E36_01489 [Methanoregulaceae archaeon PtaB.Bin009]OPY40301.1 MAG: hypothetical protein A4E41_01444 [Methanoregulaceae archaeon PtaU1.Bin066]
MSPHDLPFPDIAEWVRDHCDPARSRCLCGRDLRGNQVHGYPHDAGWETDAGRMWLFIHCPGCCYEMAIWKLGVPRDQDFRTRRFTESELCDLAWAAPDPNGIRVITARGGKW